MEVSTEKSKIMTNSMNIISAGFNMKDRKLEELTSFKYLGTTTLCKDGTLSAEIRIRIASVMAAMARLNRIWRCNTISFKKASSSSTSLLSSPASSTAVTQGLCLLTEKLNPGFRKQVHLETSLHLLHGAQDQSLGTEQDELACGSTGTSYGNCQETETCMVWACYKSRQPPQNHSLGHFGGWATPWSAEKMLDGQHKKRRKDW